MAEVIMPKMGDAMTEGKVLRWMKHPGDTVAAGEAIAELETDKVNVELLSEVIMPKMGGAMTEGKVLRWMKHPGDTVAAGEAIAKIETDKVNVELPAEESGTLTEI